MGHEEVTGVTYAGVERSKLDALCSRIMADHVFEEGHDHSVEAWGLRVLPGVTTAEAFYRYSYKRALSGNRCPLAQQVYAGGDLLVRTFKATLAVKDLRGTEAAALEEEVLKLCAARGLTLRGFAPVEVPGQLQRGLTGKLSTKAVASSEPLVTAFHIFDPWGTDIAKRSTRKEAEEAAGAFLLKHLARYQGKSLTIRKVTERADKAPVAEVQVVLTGGKMHLEVTGVKPRKSAVARGWAVSLDCHY